MLAVNVAANCVIRPVLKLGKQCRTSHTKQCKYWTWQAVQIKTTALTASCRCGSHGNPGLGCVWGDGVLNNLVSFLRLDQVTTDVTGTSLGSGPPLCAVLAVGALLCLTVCGVMAGRGHCRKVGVKRREAGKAGKQETFSTGYYPMIELPGWCCMDWT